MNRQLQSLLMSTLAVGSVGVAQAQQPSVQIYGVADAGINRTTGLAGGSRTALVSGVMDGSRLGFKGNEDLGGGYRAIFTLEHRIELDTGSISNRPFSGTQLPDRLNNAVLLGLNPALQPVVTSVAALLGNQMGVNLGGKFWDRQAYMGLVTPFGAVLAGRQYTPAYEVAAAFDTTSTQSALASGQVGTFLPTIDIRVDNSVAYRLQYGPVSAAAMLAAGEGSTSMSRFYGINLLYKGPGFSAGLGYNSRDNELKQKALTTFVMGASAEAGPGTVVASFGTVKDDNPSGLSSMATQLVALGVAAPTASAVQAAYVQAFRQDAHQWHMGYRWPMGAHTLYAAYTRLDDRKPADADVASYGVAYTYALSKRTHINFALAHFDNKNLSQAAPGQAGMIGGVTASAGTDSNSITLGLRHRF